jgi:hypothetical protein
MPGETLATSARDTRKPAGTITGFSCAIAVPSTLVTASTAGVAAASGLLLVVTDASYVF